VKFKNLLQEKKMDQSASVLVVDDELGPRESLRMILKPLYEVHTAADGKEALQCLENKKFDLVTLDLKMPGISGMEVLREIRRLQRDVEVIIVTGYGNITDTKEAFNFGAVDFISKPFNATDIVSSIHKSLERRDYNQKMKNLVQKIKSLNVIEESELDKLLPN
jgi:putative two-component system response regulator